MEQDALTARRREYLQAVIAALSTYLGSGGEMRVESARDADELTISFRLSTAEDYQAILATLQQPEADDADSPS